MLCRVENIMEDEKFRDMVNGYLTACEHLIQIYQEKNQQFIQLLEHYPDMKSRCMEGVIKPLTEQKSRSR